MWFDTWLPTRWLVLVCSSIILIANSHRRLDATASGGENWLLVVTHVGGSWCVDNLISVVSVSLSVCTCMCDCVWCVRVCPCCKMKAAWAISTKLDSAWQLLGTHWPFGQKVNGQGHAVIKCACGYAGQYDCLGFYLFCIHIFLYDNAMVLIISVYSVLRGFGNLLNIT